VQLHERRNELDQHGVELIGIGTRDHHIAERLMETKFPGIELLLDPEDSLRMAIGAAGRLSLSKWLNPQWALRYARSIRQAKDITFLWSEVSQRPGMLLLDAQQRVVWGEMGETSSDYPTADEVLQAVGGWAS